MPSFPGSETPSITQIKRTPALVATIVGGALIATVAGTGTMAQWSKSADVPGFTVTAGNLDVAAGALSATDQTSGRPDVGHAIDLSTWRAVPGDTVQVDVPLDLALDGDNIKAEIDLDDLRQNLKLDSDDIRNYVQTSAILLDKDGNEISNAKGVYHLQADDASDEGSNAAKVPAALDGTTDATVRVTLTFDPSTPDTVLTKAQLVNLETEGITLEQVPQYSTSQSTEL